MTHIHALSGAYAIDALDDVERAKFAGTSRTAPTARPRSTACARPPHCSRRPPPARRPPRCALSVLAGIATVRPIPPVVAEVAPG